ncbi:BREX-3 system P-loop-containing protein BrxF [Desulfovibrio sp. OttesenSCG-928-G11]|nr:BREX-3 system P-loop-containing protein BrxF [Desulfovibrio sp. OttesenSCG-928-G11]
MTWQVSQSAMDAVLQLLQSADATYYKLILVVGKPETGKTAVLQSVAEKLNTSVINTSLELSARLLELTSRQRALRLPEIFTDAVTSENKAAILDNLEIIFDRNLQQDPLRLLQGISRNRQVIAAWSGALEDGKLIYAEPDHAEYRRYSVNDFFVVDMNTGL